MSYTKADLLWEATRRNENYKKFYSEVAKSSKSKKDIWKKFWHPGNHQWKVDGLLDPSISSDQINTRISKGDLEKDFHPYYYILSKSKVNQHLPPKSLLMPDAQLAGNPNSDDLAELLNWLRLKVFNDSNRIIISFDIFENDESIFNEIKRIKMEYRMKVRDKYIFNEINKILKKYRITVSDESIRNEIKNIMRKYRKKVSDENIYNEIKEIKKKYRITVSDESIFNEIKNLMTKYRKKVSDNTTGEKTIENRLYNPQKINNYMEWLKRYDEIIHYFKELPDAKFSIEKGATVLNQKINFNIVAPVGSPPKVSGKEIDSVEEREAQTKFSVKEREAQTKKYKEGFEGAVLLIQSTPDIIFNISRIERLSET